jgi:hypothetical protein
MQVHNAVAAHIKTHAQASLLQAIPTPTTTTDATQPGTVAEPKPTPQTTSTITMAPTLPGMSLATQQEHMMNSHEITVLALLNGTRCYVNASTEPDQQTSQPISAGLGVFILNFQEQLPQAISVIMAEAASLALASAVCHNLNLSGVNFFSDCEQLVHFLNKNDISNPPDWRIKYFTQTFFNNTRSRSSTIFKVNRHLTTTADAMARQAAQHSSS